ncbi:MAG: cache domain-containing protein, partial [Holosporales bacterium]|nr:cache domain-containing protein [Holosporales bacterium]
MPQHIGGQGSEMRSFLSSFRFRLLIAIVGSGLLPLCVSLCVLLEHRTQFRTPMFERLDGIAEQVNSLIQQQVVHGLWQLRMMEANIPAVRNALRRTAPQSAVSKVFDSFVRNNNFYAALALLDPNGRVVATNGISSNGHKLKGIPKGTDLKNLPLIRSLLEQSASMERNGIVLTTKNDPFLHTLYGTERSALMLAQFLVDEKKHCIGVLILFLDLSLFQDRLYMLMDSLVKSGLDGGFILVLDHDRDGSLAYVSQNVGVDVEKIARYFSLNQGFLGKMDEVKFPHGTFVFGKKSLHDIAKNSLPMETYVCVPAKAAFKTYTRTLLSTVVFSGLGLIL